MAIRTDAVRWMEIRRSRRQPVPSPVEGVRLGLRQLGQARVHLAQMACPELVKGPGKSAGSIPRSASQSASFVRDSFGEREEP